ncbi:MAG: hypothetical protein B7C24_01230 [Bacteroidetes bacterium 4572_77]|nr:MAG: hypothetical protein B7C24_01230 [Bacteroidetes bacterium 4572_77]
MSEHSSTSKVILALLAGASIGAIVGASAALLLSPNDGKTNRKKLKDKIHDMSDSMHEKAEDIIDDIQEEIEKLSSSEPEKEI